MYKFTFVILHYIVAQDTRECVESILSNIKSNDIDIVVVDNGSPNQSGEELRKMYDIHSNVHVLLNQTNQGFAKGNNIGYRFAKDRLHSDFIVLINNDTIIRQQDFLERVVSKYEQTGFAVMGPDIISIKDQGHQNPHRRTGVGEKELHLNIIFLRILLAFNVVRLDGLIYSLGEWVLKPRKDIDYTLEQCDVQVHGSCLILSPKFIEVFEGLCDKTFLYMEEDILFFQLRQKEMMSLYSPDVRIYHKEDAATNAMQHHDFQKRRFKYKNMLKSAYVLLDMMHDNEMKDR